jgi:nucleoside-diphosphate-sugar epimerase
MIKIAGRVLGKHIAYRIVNSAKNEIPYQHLKDAKIRALGWQQKVSLREGLVRTYAWYEKTL